MSRAGERRRLSVDATRTCDPHLRAGPNATCSSHASAEPGLAASSVRRRTDTLGHSRTGRRNEHLRAFEGVGSSGSVHARNRQAGGHCRSAHPRSAQTFPISGDSTGTARPCKIPPPTRELLGSTVRICAACLVFDGPGRDRTCDLGIKSGRQRLVGAGDRYGNGSVEPKALRGCSGRLGQTC